VLGVMHRNSELMQIVILALCDVIANVCIDWWYIGPC